MAIVKVKCPNAVTKLSIENALLGYNELKKIAAEEFGNTKFAITYVDEYNDKISIKAREDLAIALSENVKLFTIQPEEKKIELLPPDTQSQDPRRESQPENVESEEEVSGEGDDENHHKRKRNSL